MGLCLLRATAVFHAEEDTSMNFAEIFDTAYSQLESFSRVAGSGTEGLLLCEGGTQLSRENEGGGLPPTP